MLLTFSMRRVDVGRLLLSAWQKVILQRRHCLSKDWPYSQAEARDFCLEALEMSADALRRRKWCQQCC